MSPAELQRRATAWGTELKNAGVNVNLAPTTDTVPAEIGRANGPIGQYGREYGATPKTVGQGAAAFAKGMQAAGVTPTTKHFPGIGRIQGNTDSTAEGITDTTATTKDPHLAPFAEVIKTTPTIVMIGNARYPKLDATNQAPFSSTIITGLLREQMGFDGVVITDDVGVAKAVADVPVGARATRFVAAGGDIVLTADARQTETMTKALEDRMASDEKFAAKVEAAVTRVLTLKEEMGLLTCGG
jgi:beta-N-acetylhexosaminidase